MKKMVGTCLVVVLALVLSAVPTNDSGSVYVFERRGTVWIEQAKLTASDSTAHDYFGISVYINGNTLVVGATGDDDSGTNSGSVYVFERRGAVWTEQAKLTASDGAAYDNFGSSVSLDANTLLVGAPLDDANSTDSGSVYVFERRGAVWTELAKLTASDGVAYDIFGGSVSIHAQTVLVGAPLDDDSGGNSGSVYVFGLTETGLTEQAKLIASDGTADDNFGSSVSISGQTAVVGAYGDDVNGTNSGSAYVFVHRGSSWVEDAKLLPSDGAEDDFFGHSVSISAQTAVIGAYGDEVNDTSSGSAYVFVHRGRSWVEDAKLFPSDGAADDFFGHSVSISGQTAVIGAYGDDDNGTNSGSAYVYKPSL